MLQNEVINSLNSLAQTLKANQNLCETTFVTGNLLAQVAKECGRLCPYSKVVVLYSEDCFFKVGEKFSGILAGNGVTPINVVLSEKEFLESQEQIALSLPENVRLTVTVDENHIYNAQRLANSVGVGCALGLYRLPPRIFNEFNATQTLVALDENLIVNLSDSYQVIVSKIVCLLDIKLKQFFKIISGNFDLAYDFIELLEQGLSISAERSEVARQKLVKYQISLELMERSFNHCSCVYDIKTSLCIIKLIANNLTKEFYRAPKYVERAEAVSELYKTSYLKVLEGFSYQLRMEEKFKDRLADVKKGLSALAKIYLEKTPQIISAFKALGGGQGKGAKEILQSLKYAGDIHYYNNSMSLLRETGCLEQIK